MQLTPEEMEMVVDMFEVDVVVYDIKSNHAKLIKFERR